MKQTYPLEKEEDAIFAQWLQYAGLKFSHISNEATTVQAIMRNKRIGVNSGVPDFIVITRQGLLFVEMKRVKGGVVSESQKEWITCLNAVKGVEAIVAKGAKEAIAFVKKFL